MWSDWRIPVKCKYIVTHIRGLKKRSKNIYSDLMQVILIRNAIQK